MRRLLLIVVLLSVIGACQNSSRPSSSTGEAPRITHGPMLGRLGSDQVGVWARTSGPAEFQVRYGTSPDQLDMLSESVQTRIEHDNTNWLLIGNLQSNTKYYYELLLPVAASGEAGPGGSFHTLPTSGDTEDPDHNPEGLFNFRFEFACGNAQAWTNGVLPTYETMLSHLRRENERSRVDFAILNGDWLYEEKRDYPLESWLQQVSLGADQTPNFLDIAPTIVGVWENYKLYLSRARPLAAWHRSIPSFYTFDDHEVVNDLYGTAEVGRYDRRTVFSRNFQFGFRFHYRTSRPFLKTSKFLL